jgi:hypothetical protein
VRSDFDANVIPTDFRNVAFGNQFFNSVDLPRYRRRRVAMDASASATTRSRPSGVSRSRAFEIQFGNVFDNLWHSVGALNFLETAPHGSCSFLPVVV